MLLTNARKKEPFEFDSQKYHLLPSFAIVEKDESAMNLSFLFV